MIYEMELKFMERRKALGLTNRDLANAIGIKPSTLASKLSGYSPFHKEERIALNDYLTRMESEENKNATSK